MLFEVFAGSGRCILKLTFKFTCSFSTGLTTVKMYLISSFIMYNAKYVVHTVSFIRRIEVYQWKSLSKNNGNCRTLFPESKLSTH